MKEEELHLQMCSRESLQQRTEQFKVLLVVVLFGFLMILTGLGVKRCEEHLYERWDTLPHQLHFIHSGLSLLSGLQFLLTYEACCKRYIFPEALLGWTQQ